MKTNKEDIRALKNKHRLEMVMQEAGEKFEVDSNDKNILRSTSTPGLTIDLYRQSYEIKQPGRAEEGDVLTWLQRRYSWSFSMAVNFLQSRPADPKRQDPPQAAKTKKSKSLPIVEDETKPLDKWQEKALKVGGERVRQYLTWSYWDLVLYTDEIRIDPTHAPDVATCPRCDQRIDWDEGEEKSLVKIHTLNGYQLKHVGPIPVVAYSIKHRLKISDLGLKSSGEFEKALNDLVDELGAVFVEEDDGVICSECAWREYNFQRALSLCKRSARKREQADDERRTVTAGRGASAQNF